MPASSVDAVRVAVELGGSLRALVHDPRIVPLERELAASLSDLMLHLGIDGRVGVASLEATDERALRLRVEGHEVPYRPTLLWQTWLALAGRLDAPLPEAKPGATAHDAWIHDWFSRYDGQPYGPHGFGIVEYLTTLTTAIIARRPGCLLPVVPTGWDAPSGNVLRTLLDLGVSIEDRPCIESAAAIGAQLRLSDEDIAEAAFAELRPQRVQVSAPHDLLEHIVAPGQPVSDATVHEAVQAFLDTFYGRFGVWAPPISLAPRRDLADPMATWTFAFFARWLSPTLAQQERSNGGFFEPVGC